MTESLTMSPAVRKMLLSYRDKMIAEGRSEGWQKGLYEGRREGRRAGVLKGKRSALARQLKRKFAPLPKETRSRVRALDSEEVDRYLDSVLDADSLAAMGFGVRCQSQLPFAETGCPSGRRRGKLLAGAPS